MANKILHCTRPSSNPGLNQGFCLSCDLKIESPTKIVQIWDFQKRTGWQCEIRNLQFLPVRTLHHLKALNAEKVSGQSWKADQPGRFL